MIVKITNSNIRLYPEVKLNLQLIVRVSDSFSHIYSNIKLGNTRLIQD